MDKIDLIPLLINDNCYDFVGKIKYPVYIFMIRDDMTISTKIEEAAFKNANK